MKTLVLYTGSPAGPARIRGQHVCRIACFALRFAGWHTFARDRATRSAVNRLCEMRLLEVDTTTQQFRWNDTRHQGITR